MTQMVAMQGSHMMQTPDANMVQQSEQRVLTSRAIDLISCDAEDWRISQAIAEEGLQEDIKICLREASYRLRPCKEPEDKAALVVAITTFLKTGGGNMSPAAREEFIAGCMDALEEFPVEMTVEAMLKARFQCRFSSEVLPFVMKEIKPLMEIRRTRLETYRSLWHICAAPTKRIAH